ncbi:olfactory receptor 7E24-like [Pongo abelii]|uniref:olfactory receptor 7E24-like n=1 Tax=Pongo abelii TaxID=9601 RepID=UPI00300554D0
MQTQCRLLVYLFPIFQPSFLGKSCPNDTDRQNLTDVSIFLLLELSEDPAQPVVAGLFLSMCLVTVLGNLLIILVISPDSQLHTPMYFFLSNLSSPDIGFISTTVPKMIVDIQFHSRVISYAGCLTQMCLSAIFGGMEERHAPECDGL